MVHHCLIHAFQNQSTNAILKEPQSLKMFHLYMVKTVPKKDLLWPQKPGLKAGT